MRQLKLSRAFTLIEPGPVVLVTTCDGNKNNIMTISWTMVLDFTPVFAITTGEWNYSFTALRKTRECVIAIPTVDLLDRVVGIGTCSGADTDKFAKFKLTAVPRQGRQGAFDQGVPGQHRVQSRRPGRRSTTSSCLRRLRPTIDPARKEKRTVHAVGDGTFIVDGRRLDRREDDGLQASGRHLIPTCLPSEGAAAFTSRIHGSLACQNYSGPSRAVGGIGQLPKAPTARFHTASLQCRSCCV